MSVIAVKNLTFSYDGGKNIFSGVSFNIDTDWKLGLIGRNGRGKTTLFKLMTGDYKYYGDISASVNFEYFPRPVKDENAAAINTALTASHTRERWRVERELNMLGLSGNILTRPFCTLSGGERARLLLGALFAGTNNFLLIDEPTNHLDAEAKAVTAEYLRRKTGFILVSHDRDFLDCTVDHIISINKSGIGVTRGGFSAWFAEKEKRERSEAKRDEELRTETSRLKAAARDAANWSSRAEKGKYGGADNKSGLRADRGYVGHKAAKMMKRVKNMESRIDRALREKEALFSNLEITGSLKMSPLSHFSKTLISLEDVTVVYGNSPACEKTSFTINSGDRINLRGKNGSGKTSLLRLTAGENLEYSGNFYMAPKLKISYIPQDVSMLSGSLKKFAAQNEIDEVLFFGALRKLGFERYEFSFDTAALSDGQKKKVMLAKSICEEAHLYIWDEPLNFVDLLSRIEIENLILRCRPAMLFVEHDNVFCEKIATSSAGL